MYWSLVSIGYLIGGEVRHPAGSIKEAEKQQKPLQSKKTAQQGKKNSIRLGPSAVMPERLPNKPLCLAYACGLSLCSNHLVIGRLQISPRFWGSQLLHAKTAASG